MTTRRERRKRKLHAERRGVLERRRDSADPAPADTWHYREDAGELLSPERRGNELFVDGFAAKPGVLEYKNADGTTTRELVLPQTLRDSAVGLGRAPVTLEHPEDDVDADNWAELGVGDVGDRVQIIEDTGYVQVQLCVRRRDAQSDIENGRRQELSPGYLAQIDNTPGEHPEYGRYDAIQTSRKYNHLAIVSDARGGPRIRVRTDSASAARAVHTIRSPAAEPPPQPGERRMRLSPGIIALCTRLRLDHRRYDSDEEAVQAANKKMQDMEEAMGGDNATMGYPAPTNPDSNGDPNQDEEEMYQDEEGNQLTKDQYIERLESTLRDMYETQAKGDMEPLAEDMGIETKKSDSAFDIAVKIAEKQLGQTISEERRKDSSYIGALVDAAKAQRKDALSTEPGAGRAAGRAAWGPLGGQPVADRQDAWDSRDDGYDGLDEGLADIAMDNWNDAFQAGRAGGAA